MRYTLTRSASIALALALIAMLTPAGVSEAKGGKAVSWQVAIPTRDNLASLWDQVFQDEGFRGSIRVGVSSKREGPSHFTLMLLPDTAQEGYGVSITGVQFSGHSVIAGEDPCQFGTECGSAPPDCLANLINRDHPYPAYSPGYGFAMQIGTEVNIESQPVGETALGRLFLYFDDYNDPSGQYHSGKCSTPPKTVTIQRSGPDEWTIFNDEPDAVLTCEELYLKPTGKGKGPARYVEQIVMTAKTVDPFVFETIWTRK